jgi:hypothetical protein
MDDIFGFFLLFWRSPVVVAGAGGGGEGRFRNDLVGIMVVVMLFYIE